MGIRSIEAYLRERKLLSSAPLAALANTRLGIDASHYLKNVLSDPASREPLVACTGGLPLALASKFEEDMRLLERHHIKPVLVFAGLPLAGRTLVGGGAARGPDPVAEREEHVKAEAWSHYETNDVEKTVAALSSVKKGAWTDHKDLLRTVLRVCRHRSVEYLVAPYLESAQLAYLLRHPKGYIHAVYSSTEALMWPVDKVIIQLDFASANITFVEKPRLLADLGMSDEQFIDLALLAGSDLSRTFPPISHDYSLKSAIDLIRQFKSGLVAYQSFRSDPKHPHSPQDFMRGRLAVKYSLILTTDGVVVPLPLAIQPAHMGPADVPQDLEEIFSLRLPDEVYFLVCRSLISPQVVGWLSSGHIVEQPPLADSHEYRRFIKEVITEDHNSPRCTTLALLADSLHPQWRQRRVSAHYYFDSRDSAPTGASVPFTDVQTQTLVDKCRGWVVPSSILETELRRQNSSTIDLKLCLGGLADERLAAKTLNPNGPRSILEKKDETVANVVWRFLDVRGFISANHTQATIGKAFHAAVTASRVTDKFQEPLYLLLELLRAGSLHAGPFTGTHGAGSQSSDEEEDPSALLVYRCLSLVHLTFKPQQWAGPLSRELLVFNSMVKALSKSLRQLLEGVSAHIVLSGDARRNRDDHLEIVQSLPFQTDPNTGFGILLKTYVAALAFHFDDQVTADNKDTDRAKQAKKDALLFVDQSFSSVKDPMREVERGFRFWSAVMTAVRALREEQGPKPTLQNTSISPEVAEAFETADQWLMPMKP